MTRRRNRKREALDAAYLATLTPLERFIKLHEIKPAHLAAVSGYSRQHLCRIRKGRMEPTRRCIAAILSGLRILSRGDLTVLDVFHFEDGPLHRYEHDPSTEQLKMVQFARRGDEEPTRRRRT